MNQLLIDVDVDLLQVRGPVEDDIRQCQKLLEQCSTFVYATTLKEMIKKHRVFILGEIGCPIGIIVFNASFNTISYLAVHTQFRQKGIAQKLFNYGIDYHNINSLIIKAMIDEPSSEPFWSKLGFISTQKIYTTKRKKLLEMIWYRKKSCEVSLI